MAPSEKVVADAIRNAVRRMFKGPDRDDLTVNKIRDQVEIELHLDAGFLKGGSWKQESKNIVKTESEKLLQLEEAGEDLPDIQLTPAKAKSSPPKKSASKPVKKGVKRPSNGGEAHERKRQKKETTLISEDEDSALTSIEDTPEETEDSYVSEPPEPKKSKKSAVKPVAKGSRKQGLDEGEDKNKKADTGEKSRSPNSKSTRKVVTTEDSAGEDSDTLGKKSFEFSDGLKGDSIIIGGDEVITQSDSDMSIVLDETPKRKRKSKSTSKGQTSTSTSKSSKPPKIAKPPADLSPDEAELRTLQYQLTKCGVRKIWGVILKDYGSDTKAKIRHLKSMLKDIGMEGRFSESKAREINEARELQADLDAVKAGDAIWGMGKGARSKKESGGKKMPEPSYEDEDEDEMATRSRSVSEKPARLARAKMDLAFLGDEESDSDD